MICSNCGSENNGDNRFCWVCGAPLENSYPYGNAPVNIPPKKESNGLGIAALVVGILALTLSGL